MTDPPRITDVDMPTALIAPSLRDLHYRVDFGRAQADAEYARNYVAALIGRCGTAEGYVGIRNLTKGQEVARVSFEDFRCRILELDGCDVQLVTNFGPSVCVLDVRACPDVQFVPSESVQHIRLRDCALSEAAWEAFARWLGALDRVATLIIEGCNIPKRVRRKVFGLVHEGDNARDLATFRLHAPDMTPEETTNFKRLCEIKLILHNYT